MKRPLSREELEGMGLSPTQIKNILKKQTKKKERKYKYIVMLTDIEADKISKQTGKVYIRASEWEKRRKEVK